MTRDLQAFSRRVESGADPLSSGLVDGLIVVSNREPYRHHYDDGSVAVERPTGGLTAGLDPVVQRLGGTWVAWGDGEADFDVTDGDDQVTVPPGDPSYTLQRVRLSEADVDGYYLGYANQVLWPICHSALEKVNAEGRFWDRYADVNERFADVVVEHSDASSTIWFQDYHFALAPMDVRSRLPDAFLMHFWHIPWPAPDVFRACPQRREVLTGLLGNDLLGFHVPRYCANFLQCAEELLDDATVDWAEGSVHRAGRTTTVRAFPLGVDVDDLAGRARTADGGFWRSFLDDHGVDPDTAVALGVDRLDYTKGIPRRLAALERLWETHPEFRGAFTYVQKGAESRQQIPAYRKLRADVEATIGRINQRFGTDDWRPIVYTTQQFSRDRLCTLYRHSDVALVSPLRDGMNLVAQEYVASQVDDDGVLVLSELAGVADEFGDAALTVNPYDTERYADAIAQAFEMDPEERRRRMGLLRQRVRSNDLSAWLDDVFETATWTAREGESVVEAR